MYEDKSVCISNDNIAIYIGSLVVGPHILTVSLYKLELGYAPFKSSSPFAIINVISSPKHGNVYVFPSMSGNNYFITLFVSRLLMTMFISQKKIQSPQMFPNL